ncbi:MAG: 1-acyl-sn-glycerol-3-phosphate acyltransferase [Algoriphagus sp.]|jgi:1-acyl-sn-glycerol-3-phosphate acyltransferase
MRLNALLAHFFFFKRVDAVGTEYVPRDKPVIFACTHSNSLIDAIIIYLLFKKDVYSLARGDVFNNPIAAIILKTIHMLPVWRMSEGAKNMAKNGKTFENCNELFKRNKNVLIFPEGLCINQTTLLPLKKRGTAAMAHKAWKEGIDLQIVPVVITYDSFKRFGKSVNVHFDTPISKEGYDLSNEVTFSKKFTDDLTVKMRPLFKYDFRPVGFQRNAFFILAWLINWPLYLLIDFTVKKKFAKTIFFDSIWYALLYVTIFPYLLLLFFVVKYFL